ncbi:MAG TPA: beta-ketoacyl reductase, partial [Pseudonocardiaceae bacterium]
ALGARRIGIVGRSAADPATSAPLRELATLADVRYVPCDVADGSAVAAVITRLGEDWGRLRGVVHCSGGVNPFGSLRRRDWADAARIAAPKVAGSHAVLHAAREHAADFVVLVSSIAGRLPAAGRGLVDYTLANAYQLALAEREHGPVTAVTAHAWPNWAGIGMEADATFAAAHTITHDQGVAGFATHLRTGGGILFPGAAPEPATATPAGSSPNGAAPAEVVTVVPAPVHAPDVSPALTEAMTGLVRDAFLDVLGQQPGERAIADLGLDSITIADLANAIERRSRRTVDLAVVMRARTVIDIATWLATTAATAAVASTATATTTAATATTAGATTTTPTTAAVVAGNGEPAAPSGGDLVMPQQRSGPDSAAGSLSALLRPLLTPGQAAP